MLLYYTKMTSAERVMTKATLEELLTRKDKSKKELTGLGAGSEGGHQRQALHDDPATEDRKNFLRAQIAMIGNLEDVSIITPSEDLSKADLGCIVELEYEDGFKIKGVLLGPDDAQIARSGEEEETVEVISFMSPLGQAIRGQSVGAKVTLTKPSKQEVKILSISRANI